MPQIANAPTNIISRPVDYQPQNGYMIHEVVNFPVTEIDRFLNSTFRRSRFRAYYISGTVLTDIQNIIQTNNFDGLVFHYGINNNGQFHLVISFFTQSSPVMNKYIATENPNPIFSTYSNRLPFYSTSTNPPAQINVNIGNIANINTIGLVQHASLNVPNQLIANFDNNLFLKSTPIFNQYSGFLLGKMGNFGFNNIITEMNNKNNSGIFVQFGIQEAVPNSEEYYFFTIINFGKINGNILSEDRSEFWTSRGLNGGPTNPPNGVPQVPQP